MKQVTSKNDPSMGCLYDIYISGPYNASNLHIFFKYLYSKNVLEYSELLILDFEGHSSNYQYCFRFCQCLQILNKSA